MPVKPLSTDGTPLPLAGATHGVWGKGFPQVMGWLCDAAYSDGSPLGQTQLSFKREGTVIRATLKAQDNNGIKISAPGPDPASALAALEVLLAAPKPPWETDTYPLGGTSQKRKK